MEKFKFTKFHVKVGLGVLAFLMLVIPHILRNNNSLLTGREAYFFLNGNGLFGKLINNLLLMPEKVCVYLPFILGILSIVILYKILLRMEFDENIVLLSLALFIISPSFQYLYATCNGAALPLLFTMLGYYNLLNNKLYSYLFFYLSSLFGILYVITNLAIVSIYSHYTQRKEVFYTIAPLIFYLFFIGKQNIDSYGNFITDFGGVFGIGIFILMLALFGLKRLWKKKYHYSHVYVALAVFIAISIFDLRALSYMNILLVVLASVGFFSLKNRHWESVKIKNITMMVVVFGLFFSAFSYSGLLAEELPNEKIIDAIEEIRGYRKETVFSHESRKEWIEYVGKDFVGNENLLYTRRLREAMDIIEKDDIDLIWIDHDMREEVWSKEEQGLLFLLEFSKEFKEVYDNGYVEVWRI